MSPPEHTAGAPKHRACDECRSRKLACSKEADGCSRCKREGIVCHYSAQKPMGRPRKRPRDDATNAAEEEPSAESATKTAMVTIPPDTEDPGLAFLSFLSGGDVEFDPTIPLDVLGTGQPEKADWAFGYTGNDFAQLNFDTAPIDHAPSFSQNNIDPALFTPAASSPETLPNLSSVSSSSAASVASPANGSQLGLTTCACPASLYLALDTMQKLPADITAAVRQARLAAKTAYDVVNCPVCAAQANMLPHADSTLDPRTMHNFQTMMLLATLIPSIVHAYERILTLVDIEAAKARNEGRELAFTLQNFGGIWGELGAGDMCGAQKMLSNRMMEPMIWRLTVRALLRVDVYGISDDCGNGSGPDGSTPFHLGLKDIVTQMENRSKARHAIMDPLILSGVWEDQKCALKMHKTGETPTCMRIIHIARSAIDNLVIP
ncbi:hypothetical protein BX600DRAFT_172037 [Xylariales sp. PMI_506]|nr:hypothetical protein BX600DRAFT_172037 [Xylariales sp. PMI_506]